MRTLIVYTHPNPKSFNHRILKAIEGELSRRGHEVRVRDLYQDGFNPVLGPSDFETFAKGKVPEDIEREQKLVSWADHLVFIYPIWWYDRPALLKGWVDRVFSYGFAFGPGAEKNGKIRGLLAHKRALVIQTAGNSDDELARDGILDVIQRPMTDGTLRFCGVADTRVRTFGGVTGSTPQKDEAMLTEVRETLLADW